MADRDTDEPGDEESFHEQAWEMVHWKHVLAEADKYLRAMPRSSSCTLDELSLVFIESYFGSSKVGRKVAVLLFEKRDDRYKLLTRCMVGRPLLDRKKDTQRGCLFTSWRMKMRYEKKTNSS